MFYSDARMSVSRRLQMVFLSAPRTLESVKHIVIEASQDNEALNHFTKQFLPTLRLHNPPLIVEFRRSDVEGVTITHIDGFNEKLNIPASCHALAQFICDADINRMRKETIASS